MEISIKQQRLTKRALVRAIAANDKELKHAEGLGELLNTPEFIKQVKEETKNFKEFLEQIEN